MLRTIYLVVLVTAVATRVLKYDDATNVNSKNTPHNTIAKGQVSKQYLYKFLSKPADKDAALKTDFGRNSYLMLRETKKCSVIEGVANCTHIHDLRELNVSFDITGLDLSHNNIRLIQDWVLSNFTNLTWLNISHNNLQKLSNNSFYNLSALTTLKLHGNNLSMNEESFPEDVFKPLVNLRILWIQNNTNVNDTELYYPDKAFAHLKSVRNLHMDGLPNQILGDGFRNMTSLTNLTLKGHNQYVTQVETEGHCRLESLVGDMFINVPGITHLNLIYCEINGQLVNSSVFKPLRKLKSLDLSHNDDLKFKPVAAALKNIKSKLKVLKITNIINPYSPGVKVTKEFCMSIPRELEELNATSNALEFFEDGAMQHLPKTLRLVDVGSNRFLFWSYLKDLDALVGLQTLTLSGGDVFVLPWYYPPQTNDTNVVNHDAINGNYEVTNVNHEIANSSPDNEKPYLVQPMPPNLEVLNMINGGWSNYLTEFHVNENNSVVVINLDSNNFPILQGPIVGLHSLKNLSMSVCRITKIYKSFFQNLTSLTFLNLSTNYFGNIAFKSDQFLFSDLVNLKILDLSFTDILFLSEETFQGLNMLEFLYLQRNPLSMFEVDISFMSRLTYINISSTYVMSLSPNMTKKLDNVHRNSTTFTIDLADNKLSCICGNFEFFKWMTSSPVISKTLEITCSFLDGSDKPPTVLKDVYTNLLKECASNFKLYAVVTAATFLMILAIAGVVLYHFRRRIQYLYHSAILHYKNQRDNTIEESFEYDVFVSYAHEDHDFVQRILYPHLQSRGLKIHIHGLHFVAGEYISSNIVKAVSSSRHTLVILTQHHLNSKWSKFEIEMANMEQVHTGRSVLLFLIMEKISELPTQMIFHIKNNTYINYPTLQDTELEVGVFWSRLVSALRS